MRPLHKAFFVVWAAACLLMGLCGRALAADPEEWTVAGDDAYEFLLGMAPPLRRGDWAAFELNGEKTIATIIEAEGVGADRRLVIAVEEHVGDGRVRDGGRQEVVISRVMREMAERHDHFVVSRHTATVKGKRIAAAAVKAFSEGVMKDKLTISTEVPLGEVVRHYGANDAILVDYGWGDEAYRPEASLLTFRQAADRVGAALPAPAEGEWCEYAVSNWPGDVARYHVALGKNGRAEGGWLVSLYGVDDDGAFHLFQRETLAETRFQYGEGFFDKPPHCVVSRESVSVKDGTMPGVSMKLYWDGIFVGRFHFSDALPFPWLASAHLLAEGGGVTLRLVDSGREESREIAGREARATAVDAITEVVDKALRKAAVGDWALFEVMGKGKIRYELVEIRRDGRWTYYTNLMQALDAAGNVLSEDRKSSTSEEIVNGFFLGGDVRSDRFELARGETIVNGKALSILSLTGYEGGEPRYRIDFSEDVPAVEFANMVIFDLSREPFYRLMGYGRSPAVPEASD